MLLAKTAVPFIKHWQAFLHCVPLKSGGKGEEINSKSNSFRPCVWERERRSSCVCGTKVPLSVYRCVSLGLCKIVYVCVLVSVYVWISSSPCTCVYMSVRIYVCVYECGLDVRVCVFQVVLQSRAVNWRQHLTYSAPYLLSIPPTPVLPWVTTRNMFGVVPTNPSPSFIARSAQKEEPAGDSEWTTTPTVKELQYSCSQIPHSNINIKNK